MQQTHGGLFDPVVIMLDHVMLIKSVTTEKHSLLEKQW